MTVVVVVVVGASGERQRSADDLMAGRLLWPSGRDKAMGQPGPDRRPSRSCRSLRRLR